jgi:putative intracellular protease/amidase
MGNRDARVLLALTSHATLGSTGRPTGYYVPEAAHPWKVFTEHRIEVAFVSTAGGEPPATGYDPADPVQQQFLGDREVARRLAVTPRAADLDAADYDAILFVGGHGTMWDFPGDRDLAALAAGVYEAGGVVAAVCHGPAGLVNLRLRDGRYLVEGKEVAAFTNEEEAAVGLTGVVPFLLESALTGRGAKHTMAAPFQPHVVTSERLVTGQNPASATGVAQAVAALVAAARV